MTDEERRRLARAQWPIVKTTLADTSDAVDLRATTTMDERFAMVWRLTLDAWALSGKPMPSYTRATMPIHITRGTG
ncbi:MAG: hypothetical protein U0228_38150 [Myxococcaceae bacterium]